MGRPRPSKKQAKKKQNNKKKDNSGEHGNNVSPETLSNLNKLHEALSNPEPSNREYACGVLGNLAISNTENFIRYVHNCNPSLIQNILKLLEDEHLSVVTEAIGCLRNMASVGGVTLSKHLININCLAAIEALLKKSFDTNSEDSTVIEKKNLTIECCISLLSCLSENCIEAMESFELHGFFLSLVQSMNSAFPLDVNIAAAQCLYVVTEDNESANTFFAQHADFIEELILFLSNPVDNTGNWGLKLLLRCTVTGILFNLRVGTNASKCHPQITMENLSCVLNSDIQQVVMDIAPILTNIPVNPESQFSKTAEHKNAEKMIENGKTVLLARQLALEILANMCSTDENIQLDIDNFDTEQDYEFQEGDDKIDITNVINDDVAIALVTSGILQNIVASCQFEKGIFYQLFSVALAGKPIIDAYSVMQIRALAVLNNLFMHSDKQGELTRALDYNAIWVSLAEMSQKIPYGVKKEEMLPAITNSMWSLLRRISVDTNLSPTFNPSCEEIISICHLVQSEIDESLVHIAGILGIVGTTPAAIGAASNIVEVMVILVKNSNVLIVAEALNSIFDLFAEPETSQVTSQYELGKFLKSLLPNLQSKIRRKDYGVISNDDIGRIKESTLNLKRFLQYKENQGLW